MNYKKEEKDFYTILKSARSDLAANLDVVKKRGLEDWVDLLVPDAGSHSGYAHLLNVEQIANKIVPDDLKDELSMGEIFLLLTAIFLHDIGKTIPTRKDEYMECNRTRAQCVLRKPREKLPCAKEQWEHYIDGETIIKSQSWALGLPDERIAEYCGLLTFCHGLTVPPFFEQPAFANDKGKTCKHIIERKNDYRTTSLAPYGVLRIPLLASILRVADETDNSWTRALRDCWTQYLNQNPANVGKAFRRCIEDIEFCHKGQCLIMHVAELEKNEENRELKERFVSSISKARKSINTTLSNWRYELNKIGIRLDEVYIEYDNHLFLEDLTSILEEIPRYPKLSSVLNREKMKSVQKILEAMIQLCLGSYEYSLFNWEMLEAQVGRPLTDVDKWLAGRIAEASENHILITDYGELRFEFKREDVNKIKELILS